MATRTPARTEPTEVELPSDGRRREPTITEALSSPGQLAEFKRALPAHVGVDRFVRVALTTIRTNPKLGQCTTSSLLAGLMQAAQLGLEVSGVRGQAFLVPRKNKGVMEATFQLGFRGMIDLAARSGITVDVDIVHANDEFDWQRGTDPKLYHKPTLREPGPPIAYYAVAHFADARRSQFVLRSVAQIELHRDRFASSRDYNTKEVTGPWVDHFDAMALKTVIRQLLDKLPTAVELRQAMVADDGVEHAEAYIAVGDPMGAIDVSSVDVETGEIAAPAEPEFSDDDPANPAEAAEPIIPGTAS